MENPKFVVVLASNKAIYDKNILCRSVKVQVMSSFYSYCLLPYDQEGLNKLRWLYANRRTVKRGLRWLVMDSKFQTVLAVNSSYERGSEGPDWAVTALEQVAFGHLLSSTTGAEVAL
jgi:hypothetical protein